MLRPGIDKGLATPLPLGLATLGTSAFLLGFAAIFEPTSMPPYLTQALLFGGLVELLAGMWCFAYGDSLAATTFSFLGAFFGWWAITHMSLVGTHAAAVTPAAVDSMALVFIVTGVVVAYLWVASFYEFAAFNLVLLFLWIGLILGAIAMFIDVPALRVIAGISSIIAGLIAAYASFAALYNATSLKEVVPIGESEEVRARVEHNEMERIRRIHAIDSRIEHETVARSA
jgi:uncharacterized protein